MLCHLYYEFDGTNINIVIQKNKFPYNKIKLNIWRTFYSKISYESMLNLIINGGKSYMIKIIENELNDIIKKEESNNSIKEKKEKALKLCSNICLDEKEWKILKKKSL